MKDPAIAAYYRVSSKAQTLDMQRAAVERTAASRGDTITEEYAEKVSGKTIHRTELNRLRADVRAGLVRRLYVYRLDRLARSGIRDTFEVIEELRGYRCELVTVSDGFALDGPAAEVILAVMAWAAKMERLAINERIAAARLRIEAAGGTWGRPPSVSREQAERARELVAAGRSLRKVAAELGIDFRAVWRLTKRPSRNVVT
jgi:DNA invertase Pin-like site-specific DNA recombinase